MPASKKKDLWQRQKAFTLIELVMVLMLVGIISAIAIPRFADRTTFDARGFADQAQSMLRYAQKLAIAENRNVYVRLNGADIALCFDNACTKVVSPPSSSGNCAAGWFCKTLPTGVAYAVAPAGYVSTNAGFYFSALGEPFNTVDTPPITTFNAALSMTVTGGGVTSVITVERETGYVH